MGTQRRRARHTTDVAKLGRFRPMKATTSGVSGPRRLRRAAAAVSTLAVMLLASCGSGEPPGSSGGQPADSPADVAPGEKTME